MERKKKEREKERNEKKKKKIHASPFQTHHSYEGLRSLASHVAHSQRSPLYRRSQHPHTLAVVVMLILKPATCHISIIFEKTV